MSDTEESSKFDIGDHHAFRRWFNQLPEKDENTIRFFERNNGEIYSFHGSDAVWVAQTLYKTTTVLKGQDQDYTTLTRANAMNLLRDLLLKWQYKVEIWSQDKKSWQISATASPGNLQSVEEMLFGSSTELDTSPVVVSVRLGPPPSKVAPQNVAQNSGQAMTFASVDQGNKLVGCAFADASARTLGIAEFIDNCLFSNFESLCIQVACKEVILPSLDVDQKNPLYHDLTKLRQVAERLGCVVTERRLKDWTVKAASGLPGTLLKDLTRLCGSDGPEHVLQECPSLGTHYYSPSSLSVLLEYLDLMDDEANFGAYQISSHDLAQYVRLDAAAVRALNLVPEGKSTLESSAQRKNQTSSLLGLLGQGVKTAQGMRLLARWIKQPCVNMDVITQRLDLVTSILKDRDMQTALSTAHLRVFPDLARIGKKFQRNKATLEDVLRIYQVILQLPSLIGCMESFDQDEELKGLIESTYLVHLRAYSQELEKFSELIETTLDLEAAERFEYLIRADYDPELEALKDKMDNAREEMDREVKRVCNDTGLPLDKPKGIKFDVRHPYGHHLRVSKTESGFIKGNKGYQELTMQKAGVLFTTPRLRSLDQDYTTAEQAYAEQQKSIAAEVISVASSYGPLLEKLNELIAHMDVIQAFAHASSNSSTHWVRPILHPMSTVKGNAVRFTSLRHPLLEAIDFIPNDVDMVQGSSQFQIITGPNMGGKSTYIRSAAMAVLMAQMGCFVPATNAEVTIVDAVYCRVGAGDAQLRGVSTFMMEMVETSVILKAATSNSFIVIDELGRGTSTYDGFGLAYAVSYHIASELGCFCMFATHFHELTALSDKLEQVKNLNVTAHVQDGKITLLYKVMPGVCDQSFGIHVAEMAQFPDHVIRLARRKAMELEDFSAHGHDRLDSGHASGVSTPHWKANKQEIAQGTGLIEKFLHDYAKLDVEGMDQTQLTQAMEQLKLKYKSEVEASLFVTEVLSTL